MANRNLTLAIDEELLEKARIVAIRRRTSVSKIVRRHQRNTNLTVFLHAGSCEEIKFIRRT